MCAVFVGAIAWPGNEGNKVCRTTVSMNESASALAAVGGRRKKPGNSRLGQRIPAMCHAPVYVHKPLIYFGLCVKVWTKRSTGHGPPWFVNSLHCLEIAGQILDRYHLPTAPVTRWLDSASCCKSKVKATQSWTRCHAPVSTPQPFHRMLTARFEGSRHGPGVPPA